MSTRIVILAAGQGKRMVSELPKVLHPLAGKPLLEHVLHTALKLSPALPPIVVYGHEGERVRAAFEHLNLTWVAQEQQLGTGHALQQALPHLDEKERVLILYGDVPLISLSTLERFMRETPAEGLGLMTAMLPNPQGYGRIVRDAEHRVKAIIEEKDADEATRALKEINTGIYYVKAADLKTWLPRLSQHNAQGEYYLTDIVPLALSEQRSIYATHPGELEEILGVNDRLQLNRLERFFQRKMAEKLMLEGVTLYDPLRFDLRGDVRVGRDVTIDVNVILEGRVVLGEGCVLGPNVSLRNVVLGKGVEVRANSVLDGAEVGAGSIIGPFARLRPGTVLAEKVHVGNFVEVKNSVLGEGAKANHLSYVGDADVGKQVNIGAGTITCNYDGQNKHKTVIEDQASIGAGTQLVAPVKVGKGATIGAGSIITKDAPAEQLTLARSRQQSIQGWQRPGKKKS